MLLFVNRIVLWGMGRRHPSGTAEQRGAGVMAIGRVSTACRPHPHIHPRTRWPCKALGSVVVRPPG